ncbi:MAG: HAD family hydrolase [Burkholderiales bacterium]|jgi:putative hydrolase of the HAD superfamily|nr:HAD family hydrolase [Burkholderiales bacterium]
MLDISTVQAITLDLDDTLWPIWPTIARAEKQLLAWLQVHAPATATLAADPHCRVVLRAEVEARYPELAHDLGSLRREAIRLQLARAGDDTNLAEPAYDVFIAERMNVTLFEDVLPALEWLSARMPIVSVSNGNADVHQIGIGHFFAATVTARDVGVGKPHARIFQAAAKAASVAPQAVLHVGDDAALDVVGALAVGMQTVWVNRAEHLWTQEQHPHASVADMLELCDLLGRRG